MDQVHVIAAPDPDSDWRVKMRQNFHSAVRVWISLGVIAAYIVAMLVYRLAGN